MLVYILVILFILFIDYFVYTSMKIILINGIKIV